MNLHGGVVSAQGSMAPLSSLVCSFIHVFTINIGASVVNGVALLRLWRGTLMERLFL